MSASGAAFPVIVNAAGGAARSAGDALAGRIEAAFAAAGQAVSLEIVDGQAIAGTLECHSSAPRIVIGGGDGTIGTAAQFASRRGIELALLPLGTRNHFACQLGVPPDLAAAARLAAHGTARAVDLGEAGDRIFVNNLSAGAYVDLVRDRERSALPKLVAMLPAAWRTLRKLRARRFDLLVDGEPCPVDTPLLFIGNNRYQVSEGRPGERATLDDGLLSCYAVAPLSRSALVAAALRMLVARPRMHRDFVLDRAAREVRIEGREPTLELALDGERTRVDLPLAVRILPRALAVVAPPDSD